MYVRVFIIACCALAAVAPSSVRAGDLEVGKQAPKLTARTAAGDDFSLDAIQDASAIVICFTGAGCPVARSYNDRLEAFAEKYHKLGVRVLAVNVDAKPPEPGDKRPAKPGGLQHLTDIEQQSGKAFGALATPHLFVLDKTRKLAYRGAFDNNWMNAERVSKHYVRDAVDAILAGQDVPTPTTRPIGCRIQYKRR